MDFKRRSKGVQDGPSVIRHMSDEVKVDLQPFQFIDAHTAVIFVVAVEMVNVAALTLQQGAEGRGSGQLETGSRPK